MSIRDLFSLNEDSLIGMTTSSVFSEQGGSPTFDTVPFRLRAGKNPEMNTFVVVLRQDDESVAHYGRIIQGYEFNAKADPSRLQRDEAYGMRRDDVRISEAAPDLIRIMVAEILGEIRTGSDGFAVTEPLLLPQTGQEVHVLPVEAVPALLNVPRPEKEKTTCGADGLYLGDVDSGNATVPFCLPIKTVARHIAILGKTGTGKSYAAGVLIEELHEKGIPVLSFDVLGDMETTAEELGGIHLVAGSDVKVPYSILGLSEFLAFIPNLTPDQRDLVASAYGEIFDRAVEQLDSGNHPNISFSVLSRLIENIGKEIKSGATLRAKVRTESALKRSYLLTDESVDWPGYLSGYPLVNIYVGHLDQRERNLVVGASARILQRFRRRNTVPPFVLVLDEAHLFLPASSGGDSQTSVGVLREMVRTARHDSIGIVLLTQSPASMDRQILLTCNTRIVFALDPEDLRAVAGHLGDVPRPTVERIPRLARGKALVTSASDLIRHPIIVKIRRRRLTTHVAVTPNLAEAVKRWREEAERR